MKNIYYDYKIQAWIVNGLIDKCGHKTPSKGCTACKFAGKTPSEALESEAV